MIENRVASIKSNFKKMIVIPLCPFWYLSVSQFGCITIRRPQNLAFKQLRKLASSQFGDKLSVSSKLQFLRTYSWVIFSNNLSPNHILAKSCQIVLAVLRVVQALRENIAGILSLLKIMELHEPYSSEGQKHWNNCY